MAEGSGKDIEIEPEPVEELGREGPEWRHVVVREVRRLQQPKVCCIYCNKEYVGGATRIRAHLIGRVPSGGVAVCQIARQSHPEVVLEMKQLQAEKDAHNAEKLKRRKLYDLSKTLADSSKQKRTVRQCTLPRAFQALEIGLVDEAWAKCFYANGLPFRLSEDKYFKDALKATLQHAQQAYVPPTRWKLGHSLLDSAVASLSADLQVYRACRFLSFVLHVRC